MRRNPTHSTGVFPLLTRRSQHGITQTRTRTRLLTRCSSTPVASSRFRPKDGLPRTIPICLNNTQCPSTQVWLLLRVPLTDPTSIKAHMAPRLATWTISIACRSPRRRPRSSRPLGCSRAAWDIHPLWVPMPKWHLDSRCRDSTVPLSLATCPDTKVDPNS